MAIRRFLAYIGGFVVASALALSPLAASAQIVSAHDNNAAASTGTVNDDLYISGQNVDITGTVNGDVYAFGQTVTINATVNGDVLVVGQDVSISGTAHSVRAVGQTVKIDHEQASGGVSLAGQTATITSSSSFNGGLGFAVQALEFDGSVSNGVTGVGDQVKLAGTIARNVSVAVTQLTLGSAAKIGGGVRYISQNTLNRNSGSTVAGTITRTQPQRHNSPNPASTFVYQKVWALAANLLLAIVLLWLLRRPYERAARSIIDRPGSSLGTGLLGLLVVFPLFIVLVITVIGLPLAILEVIGFGILLYLGKLFVALAVAQAWAEPVGLERLAVWLRIGVALLVYYLVTALPVVGGLIALVVSLWGIGGALVSWNDQRSASTKLSKSEAD